MGTDRDDGSLERLMELRERGVLVAHEYAVEVLERLRAGTSRPQDAEGLPSIHQREEHRKLALGDALTIHPLRLRYEWGPAHDLPHSSSMMTPTGMMKGAMAAPWPPTLPSTSRPPSS